MKTMVTPPNKHTWFKIMIMVVGLILAGICLVSSTHGTEGTADEMHLLHYAERVVSPRFSTRERACAEKLEDRVKGRGDAMLRRAMDELRAKGVVKGVKLEHDRWIIDVLRGQHKAATMGDHLIFLFPSNVVATADTKTCEITGLYMPDDRGRYHPDVAVDARKANQVAVDKRRTPRPTRRPTPKPTPRPTTKPTRHPTKTPTTKPTKYPSTKPTSLPTPKQTQTPTRRPTKTPTSHPVTASPSETIEMVQMVYQPFTDAPGVQQLNKAYNLLLGRGFNPAIANNLGSFTNKQQKYGDFGSDAAIIPDQVSESMDPHCLYSGKTSKVFQGDSTASGTFEKQSTEEGFSMQTQISGGAKGVTAETTLEAAMMFGNTRGSKASRSEAKRGYSSQFVLSSRATMWRASVSWNDEFYPFNYDKTLEARLAALDKSGDNVKVMKFFFDYGTHVVEKATFGAECHMTVGMTGGTSSSSYDSFRSSSQTSNLKVLWYSKSKSQTSGHSTSGQTSQGFQYSTTNIACNGQMTANVCDANMNAGVDDPAMIGAVGLAIWDISYLKRKYPAATRLMGQVMRTVVSATAACGRSQCGSNGVCQIRSNFWSDVVNGKWNGNIDSKIFSPGCVCFPGKTSANCEAQASGVLRWVQNEGQSHKSCKRICSEAGSLVKVQSVGYPGRVARVGSDVCALTTQRGATAKVEGGYVANAECHSGTAKSKKFGCLCSPSAKKFTWLRALSTQKLGCKLLCDANGYAAVGSGKWSSGDQTSPVCSAYVRDKGNLVGFEANGPTCTVAGSKFEVSQYQCLCMVKKGSDDVTAQSSPVIEWLPNAVKTEWCQDVCDKRRLPPVSTGQTTNRRSSWKIAKGSKVTVCRGTTGNRKSTAGFSAKRTQTDIRNACGLERGEQRDGLCACNTLAAKLTWVHAFNNKLCIDVCKENQMKAVEVGVDGRYTNTICAARASWIKMPGFSHSSGNCWAYGSLTTTNKDCLCY